MDNQIKQLIKFSALLETHNSDKKFQFKPKIYQDEFSFHCLEVLVFYNQSKVICSFNFVCNTNTIYIEDYGKIFTTNAKKNFQKEFSDVLNEFKTLLRKIQHKDFNWMRINATCSISNNFEYLIELQIPKK